MKQNSTVLVFPPKREVINTRKELAKIVVVGYSTYAKGKKNLDEGTDEEKKYVRCKGNSIGAIYEELKHEDNTELITKEDS